MLLGPLLVASLSIPHVFEVYVHVPARILGLTILVGAVAGTSGFLYSRAVPVIGFGLATAFDSGSGLAVGSLLPLIGQPPGFLKQPSSLLSLLGIAIAVSGIIVCAKAGRIRESEARQQVLQSIPNRV
jgi:L-rhamnose-H+ transport protein